MEFKVNFGTVAVLPLGKNPATGYIRCHASYFLPRGCSLRYCAPCCVDRRPGARAVLELRAFGSPVWTRPGI
ncbi:hypothetical protein U2A404270035 [Corynebacterium striatum]|nr:hypothetical protein U2A404270035 [Corynebacterium striatum]